MIVPIISPAPAGGSPYPGGLRINRVTICTISQTTPNIGNSKPAISDASLSGGSHIGAATPPVAIAVVVRSMIVSLMTAAPS